MNNELETKGLVKTFDGVHAVDHLSVSFPSGKVTGLIGPNGSGKTTLINLLSGFYKHDGGKVLCAGEERESIVPWDNPTYGITRTFQQVRLFEQLTALDNLLVVLTERAPLRALFEKHKAFHIAKAEEILKRVGLYEKRKHMAADLSYGQRKLLEIARVLAMDTRIALFDEPFAGLFPEVVKQVEKLIAELKEEGKTIILVEHNMNIIRKLCDYVVVMDAGKLLAEGEPEKVLERRDVITAYLGE